MYTLDILYEQIVFITSCVYFTLSYLYKQGSKDLNGYFTYFVTYGNLLILLIFHQSSRGQFF